MRKHISILLSAILSVATITGCSTQSVNDTQSEINQSNSNNLDTIIVSDVRGEVEIPSNPERVVDLSGTSDVLAMLGYNIVGTANSDGYDYTVLPTYLEETLEGATILGYSMIAEMDIESIITLTPDLIVISTVQEKMYEQLKEIAPVVMLDLKLVDWKEDVMTVANTFHRSDDAQAWLDNYSEYAEKIGSEIKSIYGDDTSYLAFLASAGSLYIFDAAGIGSILYDDLLLSKPENLPAQADVSLPVVTLEGLVEIDTDYMFVIATPEDMQFLNENSVWNGIEAIKNNQYVELTASPYFNQGYSPIGRLEFVEDVQQMLEDSYEK